jgi:hypothetical protein
MRIGRCRGVNMLAMKTVSSRRMRSRDQSRLRLMSAFHLCMRIPFGEF